MSRLFDKLLVAVYVALAALPVFAMVTKIRGHQLNGVLERKRTPHLNWRRVLTENYQHTVVAWFESNLGLKGSSIAIDNAILFTVFGETKPFAPVRLGLDDVLFNDEDINHLAKNGPYLPDPAYVNQLADKMAALQRRLAAEQRAFVPVLVPAKTSIWRDKVPARWKLDLPDPPPSDTRGYVAMKQAFDERGVIYVDARALFAAHPREDVFGRDARHWSNYGACLTLREVASAYARLTGKPRPPHECKLQRNPGDVERHGDFDLFRLLNAAWIRPASTSVPDVIHPAPPPGPKPHVLMIGTSFCSALMSDAYASGLYGSLWLDYYHQVFSPLPMTDNLDVVPGDATYRRIVLGKDLYVLDLFESYLGAPGGYVPAFLDEFRAELDRTTE
jgi:hypothetical protein